MTKETEKAFKILYCEYKRRRKEGMPKDAAIEFQNHLIGKIPAFQRWLPEDVDCAIIDLKDEGVLRRDVLGNVSLRDEGIEYMEEKPKEFFHNLKDFFDLISIFC